MNTWAVPIKASYQPYYNIAAPVNDIDCRKGRDTVALGHSSIFVQKGMEAVFIFFHELGDLGVSFPCVYCKYYKVLVCVSIVQSLQRRHS